MPLLNAGLTLADIQQRKDQLKLQIQQEVSVFHNRLMGGARDSTMKNKHGG